MQQKGKLVGPFNTHEQLLKTRELVRYETHCTGQKSPQFKRTGTAISSSG